MDNGFVKHTRSVPYDPDNTARAKRMRQSMTPAEHRLWFGLLKDFPYRVYRQRPILHYIADFYCARLKLVIEIDGVSHLSQDSIEYDCERTNAFKSMGIGVLRFSNSQVLTDFHGVCLIVENTVKQLAPERMPEMK